jgi:DMSO/TMAO reductase YedYZ molybdopterin-dependent catalytic subunit
VPWVGFPLRKLVAAVRPLPGARYVRFESDTGAYLPQVGATIEPGSGWPYVVRFF